MLALRRLAVESSRRDFTRRLKALFVRGANVSSSASFSSRSEDLAVILERRYSFHSFCRSYVLAMRINDDSEMGHGKSHNLTMVIYR